MDDYLFEVSLGPVQAFIASARRTRDLKAGSKLLSELSKVAAKTIAQQQGFASLIFPAPASEKELEQGTELNVANKIVARISGSPRELGKAVQEAVHKQLMEIANEAYGELGEFDREIARKQVDDLIECVWVAVPSMQDDYYTTRQRLEAVMSARKNTRDFRNVSWGSEKRKSSITGQLESVIPENYYPLRQEDIKVKRKKQDTLYKDFKAGPTERLSGVDLLKRHCKLIGADFPSTSHMASLSFLRRLDTIHDNQAIKDLWDIYLKKCKVISENEEHVPKPYRSAFLGNLEGSYLFEERWVDRAPPDLTDTKAVNDAIKALREFYHKLDSLPNWNHAHPNPYYAILQADGDSMGEAIDRLERPEGHCHLSRQLDTFASSVRGIVQKHDGALIYAGGDDVLALLPLHQVLQCASELAATFREKLSDDKGHSPTLSVGVAIVHHLVSLRDALDIAREAERRAKKVDGKNALAITISKRGGGERTIVGTWQAKGKENGYNIGDYLEQLITYCREGAIPHGMAYELQETMQRLMMTSPASSQDADDQIAEAMREIAQKEVGRIIARKLSPLRGKLAEARSKEIEQHLLDRLQKEQQPSKKIKIEQLAQSLELFVNELIVAQTLADARELAGLDKEH